MFFYYDDNNNLVLRVVIVSHLFIIQISGLVKRNMEKDTEINIGDYILVD